MGTTDFDDILVDIEGNGWYQKRLTYLLLCPIFFFMPFAFLCQIFVLHIPDHWCTPPPGLEPETLNITLDEWKATFLPITLGPDYLPRASQCQMYAVDNDTLPLFLSHELPPPPPANDSQMERVNCEAAYGWSYDRSEMYNTAVTDNDWVCGKAKRATDLFTLGVVGLIVGTGIFSAIADFKGRKISFFISTAFMIVLTIISIFISHIYGAYLTFKILSFMCMLPLFQSPLNITTEISTFDVRGLVIGIACIAWSIGNCALPLFGWLINRWKILQAVCTIPMAFIFFCWKIVPESPRWLISKGRVEEANSILEEICMVNKTDVPPDMHKRLSELSEEHTESSYGFVSLFSSWTLAKRTVFVTIGFTASAFVYYQLMINIGNLAGNIFLNLFLLGLVEGPGCALGVIVGNKYGRRWTHTILLTTNAILFFVLMWIAYNPNVRWLVIVLCMWIKLNISGTFVLAYMQAMEVFPTNIRQSGIGFATLISQTISIGGPYVIYLGATDLKLPYMVMFLICLVGAVSVSFLPETLNCKLPETLAEASSFGTEDKYFSLRPHGYIKPVTWNDVMSEVFDGPPNKFQVHPELVKDLLEKHYKGLRESNI